MRLRNWLFDLCYVKMHTSKYFGKQWEQLFELLKTKEWRELENEVAIKLQQIKSSPCYNCGEKSVGNTPEGYACINCFNKMWNQYENRN